MKTMAERLLAGGPLRLLLLEDHAPDADLLVAELARAGFDLRPKRVGNSAQFHECLAQGWDLILADFALPQFDALKALEMLRERGFDIPLIVVTGAVSEEVAVDCIKRGAADYLLKDRLTRLPSAVCQALEQRRVRNENARAHQALHESEQRLRALIEHSSDGLLLLDSSGRVLHRYNDLLDSGDNWYSANFLQWMVPEDRSAVRDEWQRLGENVRTIQFRVSNGSPGIRRIEATCNDLQETPCVGAIVVHYRDVTERLQLEEQFRHAQKMQAVGQLAAGLGHDFNNLLTIVTGRSDLLAMRGDLPEHARRGVRDIQEACVRAGALTHELLAFSRKQVSQPRVIDLNRVIHDLIPLLESLLGARFELHVRLREEAGPVRSDIVRACLVRMDESGLQQVIMNLVVNARDAMADSGIVTIESNQTEGGVVLSVSDTGCGMDQQTVARIFEPFFTTKDVGKGTGLGLSTVYAIVTNASGTISVESEPGKGSRFRIVLPRALPDRVEPPAPGAIPRETILLVDDEDRLRDMMAAILQPVGYHVIIASSAEQALEMWHAARRPIDLLITDVRMPGVKGPELARVLLDARRELEVLFVSGYAGAELDLKGGDWTSASLLPKPFTASALLRRVREVLDTPTGRIVSRQPREAQFARRHGTGNSAMPTDSEFAGLKVE